MGIPDLTFLGRRQFPHGLIIKLAMQCSESCAEVPKCVMTLMRTEAHRSSFGMVRFLELGGTLSTTPLLLPNRGCGDACQFFEALVNPLCQLHLRVQACFWDYRAYVGF